MNQNDSPTETSVDASASADCYALIPHRRQFFTFAESLVIGAAVSSGDFAAVNRVHLAATARALCIPASLLNGPSNYSSHRAYA
jgi:hypothetical protein